MAKQFEINEGTGCNRNWLLGLILLLAVILAYQPVWHAGFIWDDDDHVTANPCIIGPLGLKEIWTTSAAKYYPLVLTTFWVEHALWGLAPLPYHLVNVLLHGICAILLWQVLRSLRVRGAWLGAALWALHPVQVESVAWISEMKNTESSLFFLLSILFFVRWLRAGGTDDRKGDGWNYPLTLLFAALAMASKSSTVILPVVLCLCAWLVEGRFRWRRVVRVGPIFLMSAIAAALAMWTVDLQGVNTDTQWALNWPQRLIGAGDAFWFYLGKLVWPHPLIFIYPRWGIDAGWWCAYLPLLAVVVVMAVFWRKRGSWSGPWFLAGAYFLSALLPVLGLVQHYFLRYSLVADHLQYLAGMGPLALAGAGLARLSDSLIPGKAWLQSSLCALLLLVLGTLSWERAWVYISEETLWTDTLAKNSKCWMAYDNLGSVLSQKGQIDAAMIQFQKALDINPSDASALNNLGLALFQKGRIDEAVSQYKMALQNDPNFDEAYNNLGNALVKKGQVDEAIAQYRKAVEINPNNVSARTNLGLILFQRGD